MDGLKPGDVISVADLHRSLGHAPRSLPDRAEIEGRGILLVRSLGSMLSPDCIASDAGRAGDVAEVFFDVQQDQWRSGGWARWDTSRGGWVCEEVDYATWARFGQSRTVSRRLPEEISRAAVGLAADVVAAVGVGGWISARRGRCRILGQARGDGIKLDGGPDGFRARTVSVTDLGWVVATALALRVPYHDLGLADVNQRRYLRGTPHQKTRWVDTELAIALARATAPDNPRA